MITYVWRRRTKTKKTNHIQDTHNQLWSPMSEGGEQKPKRLIIYKTHIISYDSPPSDIGDHSWLCVSYIWLVFLVFVLLLQTYVIISAMITYVWRKRTKTKKVNHIQDAHNQLWWPMSEGRELIVCFLYMINALGFCSPPSDIGDHSWLYVSCIIYKKHTISYDHLCLKEENKNQKH
jgi:hypothetical protein